MAASNTLGSVAPKSLFVAGVVFLLVGLAVPAGVQRWLDTRTGEPVDVPATVSEAKQTVPFALNFRARYWVEIRHDLRTEDCAPDAATLPHWKVQRIRKWARQQSEFWAESSPGYAWGTGMELQGFDAPAGNYQLEIEYPKGIECLKSRNPRLLVNTSDLREYQEWGEWISAVSHYFAAVGAGFLPWSLVLWLRKSFGRQTAVPRIFPEMVPRHCVRWIAHRPQPLLTDLPNFGLICGAVLFVLVFIFMIFTAPHPSRGLYVQLRTRDARLATNSPWPDTLSVYLGAGEKFYVNGQIVRKDELATKLQQELDHRAEWTVYFEADYDTLNMNAIYAMDTIQGLGAKLVWITPQVRKELEEQSARQDAEQSTPLRNRRK